MRRAAFLAIAVCSSASMLAIAAEAADALQSRVSIEFRDEPAAHVLQTLAAAAGMTVEIGSGQLRPVTITLTNVRLGTALNAVCENASCLWELRNGLKVTPIVEDKRVMLPPMVSLDVRDIPARDVFRALATALDVPLSIEIPLPNAPAAFRLKNADPSDVLNMLCGLYNCRWTFDQQRGLRLFATR